MDLGTWRMFWRCGVRVSALRGTDERGASSSQLQRTEDCRGCKPPRGVRRRAPTRHRRAPAVEDPFSEPHECVDTLAPPTPGSGWTSSTGVPSVAVLRNSRKQLRGVRVSVCKMLGSLRQWMRTTRNYSAPPRAVARLRVGGAALHPVSVGSGDRMPVVSGCNARRNDVSPAANVVEVEHWYVQIYI